jgi:hypothetical protein
MARAELRALVTINPSDRPWQMPLAAAIASGAPMLIAAQFGLMAQGVIASIGGLAFLYLPRTPLHHRMVTMMACSFGMICCYALGIVSHVLPHAQMPMLTLVALLVTLVSRYYRLSAPGPLFFIMAAAIGAYAPAQLADLPVRIGLMALGSILASAVAFLYSLHILRRFEPMAIPPAPVATFDYVWLDSILVGLCVGIALAIAELLRLEKPYWVAVSCLAIIQGVSLRAAWSRQVHRVVGTTIGLMLTWGLLAVTHGAWPIALAITILTFCIETAVVRHYGFATIFITPLTILLAEAPTLGHGDTAALIEARFIDTLLGAFIGFLGAFALHNPRFRARIAPLIRALIPDRFIHEG